MSVIALSVFYGVVAAIGWGVADFVAAAASKRIGVLRTATGVHLSSSIAVAGYFVIVFEPGILTWAHWAALASVSVLAVLVYLCFYRALREGPVAVVSPIVSCYAIVVIVLAMAFSGERLSGWQALGAMCSIGGVALASFDPRGRMSGGRIIGLGVGLAVVTMLSIGLLSYVNRAAIEGTRLVPARVYQPYDDAWSIHPTHGCLAPVDTERADDSTCTGRCGGWHCRNGRHVRLYEGHRGRSYIHRCRCVDRIPAYSHAGWDCRVRRAACVEPVDGARHCAVRPFPACSRLVIYSDARFTA